MLEETDKGYWNMFILLHALEVAF